MWGHSRKRLEIRVPNKPVKGPFQIAEGVLEGFSPVFLLVEALSDGIIFYSVILNPAKEALDYQ